jgi:hypothetical protein
VYPVPKHGIREHSKDDQKEGDGLLADDRRLVFDLCVIVESMTLRSRERESMCALTTDVNGERMGMVKCDGRPAHHRDDRLVLWWWVWARRYATSTTKNIRHANRAI